MVKLDDGDRDMVDYALWVSPCRKGRYPIAWPFTGFAGVLCLCFVIGFPIGIGRGLGSNTDAHRFGTLYVLQPILVFCILDMTM